MDNELLEKERHIVESCVVETLTFDLECEFDLLGDHRSHALEHLLLFVAEGFSG